LTKTFKIGLETQMTDELDDKIAFITGAASGIGLASAEAM
jgi:NADP-dependent 3-hydroxy acid dehydrogenase YdfG